MSEIKQKAIEAYDEAVDMAKETLISKIKDLSKEFILSVFSGAAIMVKPIIDALNTLKDGLQTATTTYKTIEKSASITKATAISTQEQIIETAKQAAEVYKDQKLNSSGLSIDAGITKKVAILSTVDQSIEADTNSDGGLYLMLSGSKVKLNSMDELVKVIKTINQKLNNEDPAAVKSWVHKILHTHPIVDERIKDLEYFSPISNETGSTYLQHTPDTATLALTDWSTKLANPFRRTLKYKLDESYNVINNVYYSLNKAMVRNISTEYFDERKDQGNNYLNKQLLSNDFHIAGDYSFRENHFPLLEQILMTLLISNVGGAGKLINWLSPINNYDTAICGGVLINVEGNNVVVNLKGDKVGVIATVIDTTPITPLKEGKQK